MVTRNEFDNLFGSLDEAACAHMIPDASSGDGVMRTDEQCQEWAAALNCHVVMPQANQLFLDLDTEHAFGIFSSCLIVLRKHFNNTFAPTVSITPSKQGLPHRHVVVTLREDLDPVVRVCLQACLGSDPMRELLTLRRVLNNEPNPVIFFELNGAK